MLQKEVPEKLKGFNENTFSKHQSQNALEDLVLSISHRLSLVEAGLNSKIDRSQCMLILQSKANFSQIKKIAEQLSSKVEFEKRIAEQKLIQQQKQNKKEVEKLRQKLKCKKKQEKKNGVDKNIFTLKPQQLYLESNETMFSIIVDQISALKQAQQVFEKSLQQRNKVTINLNNEVCSKIQTLEREIETSLKTIKDIRKQPTLEQSRQSWSNSQQLQSRVKQSSKNNFHKTETNNNKTCTQLHQTSHILRTIENLQKDMSTKINIKDVLPIIKKNMQPLSMSIEQVRKYCEEAIQSTKKILINQSEINQELCTVSKMGWWQSFQERNGIAVWNKQIANLVPEIFSFTRESNQIELVQQGSYVIKMLGEELPETIIVGNQQIQIIGQSIIKVQKNTVIQVPSSGGQIFLTILKI